jgi:acid phosphatase family membrane protein YuiD
MINKIAISALLSGLLAQVVKILIDLIKTKRMHILKFFDTGGMPSSHTALVTTLTIGVGLKSGIDSSLFSVVLIFSLYFILEATGLRQEVGKQAKVLNEIVDEMLAKRHLNARRLKELVGHTWGEVFVGLMIGAAVAIIAFF